LALGRLLDVGGGFHEAAIIGYDQWHQHMTDTLPQPELSVVVPVYCSQDSLQRLVEAVFAAFPTSPGSVEVILVNDASTDASWEVMTRLAAEHPNLRCINLRRNFGQDNAILTGLRYSRGDYVAIMDDDLQHDPADLPRLLELIKTGPDVVYATYKVKQQSLWKNIGSWLNGKTAEWLLVKPKNLYISPYKIICRAVVDVLCVYDGPYPYVDGLLFQITSRFSQLEVTHHRRKIGRGSYSLRRSISVWLRLFSSFSLQPLRIVTFCGLMFAVAGLLGTIALIIHRLVEPADFYGPATGWASLMVAILVIGGIQMVFLGVIGEYLGRTYLQVNKKPQTLVRETLNLPEREG